MYTVYQFVPFDRSSKVVWTLEELGLPYQTKALKFKEKEHRGAEYLKISPMGMVPAIVDEQGNSMFESNAICMMLADKFPEKNLWGKTKEERNEVYKWLMFGPATLEMYFSDMGTYEQLDKEYQNNDDWKEYNELMNMAMKLLSTQLEKSKYLVGDSLTLADISIGYTLRWTPVASRLNDFPKVREYKEMLAARPAAIASKVLAPRE